MRTLSSLKFFKFFDIIFEYWVNGPKVETRNAPKLEAALKLKIFKILLRETKITNSII